MYADIVMLGVGTFIPKCICKRHITMNNISDRLQNIVDLCSCLNVTSLYRQSSFIVLD